MISVNDDKQILSVYAETDEPVIPELIRLLAGNKDFVDGKLKDIGSIPERRHELYKGQSPFAIILSCSDSRVPPELVFNQGLGDVFVVRTAGNVADAIAIGSIEYAAEHLRVPLLVVMGHEKCGAVTATVTKAETAGSIGAIVEKIKPVISGVVDSGLSQDEKVEMCVNLNVANVIKSVVTASPILSHLISEGKLNVVGAKYMLDTGEVKILTDVSYAKSLVKARHSSKHTDEVKHKSSESKIRHGKKKH